MFKNTYFFWLAQRCKNTKYLILNLVLLSFFVVGCKSNRQTTEIPVSQIEKDTINLYVGASQLDAYLPLLKGKNVAVVGNQTSIIQNSAPQLRPVPKKMQNYTHLVDTLLALNVKIKKVFSPEHGFRGKADAGEKVADNVDTATGLPIISLYGSNRKPKADQLKNVDIILFDLQDVGVRFYTYISTLHYVMEAAAQENIPLVVLDRPNPNGHYVDGPILEDKFRSFIGMHPVPIVYGLTIGEYAQMINGENWLNGGIKCNLTIIPIKNYTHKTAYNLPIKPSPNLPNAQAVRLYPSLCFFEGTTISCGRGTEKQFQIFGSPELPKEYFPYSFTPQPNEGAKNPKHNGELCYGLNLQETEILKINLQWILDAYSDFPNKNEFFNSFFKKLAGTETLQNQIELGYSTIDIEKTWQPGLEKFKKIRLKYLLYE